MLRMIAMCLLWFFDNLYFINNIDLTTLVTELIGGVVLIQCSVGLFGRI